jgi:hypothetical protein
LNLGVILLLIYFISLPEMISFMMGSLSTSGLRVKGKFKSTGVALGGMQKELINCWH